MTTEMQARVRLVYFLKRLLMYGTSLAVLMAGSQAIIEANQIIGLLYLVALGLLAGRTIGYLIAFARCLWLWRSELVTDRTIPTDD